MGVDEGVGDSIGRIGADIPPNSIDAKSTALFPAGADSSSLPSSASDGSRSQSSEFARGRVVIGAVLATGAAGAVV